MTRIKPPRKPNRGKETPKPSRTEIAWLPQTRISQLKQAVQDREELRAKLLQQFNLIFATRDTARGLIVSLSDVLFDTGKSTLRPQAREKLAKISGIVLAYPDLRLAIEGNTDSVGSDAMNQTLSEQRAGSVRDYLAKENIPAASMTSQGFGKIATRGVERHRRRPPTESPRGTGGLGRSHRNNGWGCVRSPAAELPVHKPPVMQATGPGDSSVAGACYFLSRLPYRRRLKLIRIYEAKVDTFVT